MNRMLYGSFLLRFPSSRCSLKLNNANHQDGKKQGAPVNNHPVKDHQFRQIDQTQNLPMEVVEACSEQLSNRQVLALLKKYTSKKHTNLATILYETTSYLESSPVANCSMKNVVEFLDTIKARKYELTKLEKIQIINLMPENETELHLIVDNIDEKLDEQQRTDLLELIKTILDKQDSQQLNKKVKT